MKGGGQPAVSTVQTGVPAGYEKFFDQLVTGAQSNFQTQSQTPVPNINIAGFDPNQVNAQNQIVSLAEGPLSQLSQTMLGTLGTNLTDFLRPDNPVVQGAADAATAPILRAFEQSILPGIQGEAVRTGNVGSSRQGVAEGLAAQGAAQAVGETGAQVTNQAFQTGLDQMIKSLALAPDTIASSLFPQLAQAGVGEQIQQQEQRELDAETINAAQERNRGTSALANYANILFGLPFTQAQSTQEAAQGATGPGQVLGLGLQGASLGAKIAGGATWGGPVGAGLGVLAGILG